MKNHILIVSDGRSPTALSWIKNIQSLGYDVSLISTFPCNPPQGMKFFHILPIAFSNFTAKAKPVEGVPTNGGIKSIIKRFAPFFQSLRYIFGPLSLFYYAKAYQNLVQTFQPDLVHALRIPFEGMLGSYTPEGTPFLAATWGNDLTLHAKGSWLMRWFTNRCLARADGMTADTQRDVRLAHSLKLSSTVSTLVIPGSGGVELEAIQNAETFDASRYQIPKKGRWVVNPRGIRPGSVHQDVFFESIPTLLKECPDISIICPGLAGIMRAEEWVTKYGIENQTFLLPKLKQSQLWALLKESAVFVSPSSHDGTPNTLLEAMAAGCFPVVGNIESLREWIEHRKNGLLINPQDPNELAGAIGEALNNPDIRQEAAKVNLDIIKNRAAREITLPEINAFYTQFLH